MEARVFDIEAMSTWEQTTPVTLVYELPSRQIRVGWESLTFSKSKWRTNGKIVGVYDLDQAYCYFELAHSSFSEIYNAMRPHSIEVIFDNYSTTLQNFQRMEYGPKMRLLDSDQTETNFTALCLHDTIMESHLPSAEAILSGELNLSGIDTPHWP